MVNDIMRNTPNPPAFRERDTDFLIEDLCIALRNVGVFDGELPSGSRVSQAIADVRSIKHELDDRGINVSDRMATLSTQTSWLMGKLLEDCLAFPDVVPYVRESDGIRRRLRCSLCRKAERPPDSDSYWMCDDCLRHVIEAIKTRTPAYGVLLFRTYNSAARCPHADAETVLAQDNWSDNIFGNCEKCFQAELERRMQSPSSRVGSDHP